jgi:hypothetical protein
MPAGYLNMTKSFAMVESDATERLVDLPGMCSVMNVGAAEVFAGSQPGLPTTKVQADGAIFLPVNVPVPLPREVRKLYHKTASGTAVLLVMVDVR